MFIVADLVSLTLRHYTMNKLLFHQDGFTITSLSATVTRVSNFVEENVCVCVLHLQGTPSRSIQSRIAKQIKHVNRNALSMLKH